MFAKPTQTQYIHMGNDDDLQMFLAHSLHYNSVLRIRFFLLRWRCKAAHFQATKIFTIPNTLYTHTKKKDSMYNILTQTSLAWCELNFHWTHIGIYSASDWFIYFFFYLGILTAAVVWIPKNLKGHIEYV